MKRVWIPVLAGAAALLCSTAWAGDWHRAETSNFIVYGEGSQSDLRARAEQLERLDALLRQLFGLSPASDARKLPVYLVRGRAELRRVNPHIAPRTVGFYSSSVFENYAVLDRLSDPDVLYHEYAHHFMLANFSGSYPAWYVEGFAEFFMTANVESDGKIKVGYFNPSRLHALNSTHWLSMDTLLTATTSRLSPPQRSAFYAQSWLLTHYFMSSPERRPQLDAYLQAVRSGTAYEVALKDSTGMTPVELERALKSYLRSDMPYAVVAPNQPDLDMEITTLPASADVVLLHSLNLQFFDQKAEDMADVVAKVRRDIARYPDDPLALTTLARAEYGWGDMAASEAALKRALEVSPAYGDALRLLAHVKIQQAKDLEGANKVARLREAQGLLVQAIDVNPTDYRLYRALVDIRRDAPSYPSEADIEMLYTAFNYAPQVSGIRAQLADALRKVGRAQEADALMSVLQSTLH